MTSGQAGENLVKAGLDFVAYGRYTKELPGGEVSVLNDVFFKQGNTDKKVITWEEYEPPEMPEEHNEEQEVKETSIRIGNNKTARVKEIKIDLPVSRELFRDAQFGLIGENARESMRKQIDARNKFGFNNTYNDAFTGTNVTTPDGAALISNSHTTLAGTTVDNLETGVLNPDNFETLLNSLEMQRDQRGDWGGHVARGAIVPRTMHYDLREITGSELRANSAENNLNSIGDLYPGLVRGASGWMHSNNNTLNSNANTSYLIVSEDHQIHRDLREGMFTELVPWMYDKKDRYIYKGRFAEVCYPRTWTGVVGSSGTV